MKTSIDLQDRIYQLLTASGFVGNLAGGITTDPQQTVTTETMLMTSTGSDNGYEVVDTGNVALNLLVADKHGKSDTMRFRYLIDRLFAVLEAYEDYRGDFDRYVKDNTGQVITEAVTPNKEYFHLRVVSTDGVAHDPEREGFSYFSTVLECWIEK